MGETDSWQGEQIHFEEMEISEDLVSLRDFVTKAERPFPSAMWLWHLPDVEIRVEQDRGTLGHGQATIMWEAGLKELLARGGTW